MRIFTAIDLPADVRARLGELLVRLRPLAALQWAREEKLHITTKFIGEWPENRLEELVAALAKVKRNAPLEISVKGLAWLPNERNGRVLMARVEASQDMAELAADTEKTLAAIGVPAEERAYHPHLTLARRRDRGPAPPVAKGEEKTDFGTFPASSFMLFLSSGGKYTPLREFFFHP